MGDIPLCMTSTPVRGQPHDCNWPDCGCIPRGEFAELILEHAEEVARGAEAYKRAFLGYEGPVKEGMVERMMSLLSTYNELLGTLESFRERTTDPETFWQIFDDTKRDADPEALLAELDHD